jgi:hypothetical protein
MDLQEPRNHGEWCERGPAALRVATVLQHRAFSALVLRKIILYDRPKRERKARDCAGVQPCWCRHPVAERSRAEAVQSIRRCRGRVPLQSLPRMAVSGLPEVPHAQTAVWARERTGPWQGVCATAPLWPMCAAVRACTGATFGADEPLCPSTALRYERSTRPMHLGVPVLTPPEAWESADSKPKRIASSWARCSARMPSSRQGR